MEKANVSETKEGELCATREMAVKLSLHLAVELIVVLVGVLVNGVFVNETKYHCIVASLIVVVHGVSCCGFNQQQKRSASVSFLG